MTTGTSITRRRVVGGLVSVGAGAVTAPAIATTGQDLDRISSDIGEMLMLGFTGNTIASKSARILAGHIAAGRIGNVVFVLENVGNRADVMRLLQLFSPNAPSTVLAAIDHEGGIVQRLTERHGFTTLPAARLVAAELSPDRARVLYAKSAAELAAVGFNLNLAPVVDLHDPLNPQIGHFGRSFDADPAIVTAYAESFIGGFASANVLCAPKHFPGLGHCHDDSHDDLPDITSTWSEIELKPFAQLIARGEAHVIMGGHVRLDTVENEMIPTTLSSAVTTGLLRDKLAFQGVAMTDDLDMAAVHNLMGRREAVIRAIAAGNDLLMVRNATNFDPCLPQNIVDWVNEAISKGSLSKDRIRESADRVRRLKQALANGVAVPSVPR